MGQLELGDGVVRGYRFESRMLRRGADGVYGSGEWAEHMTLFHPGELQGSEVRNAVELVPDPHAEDPVGYYCRVRRRDPGSDEWSEWEEEIFEFHPEKLTESSTMYDRQVQDVVPLVEGDEIEVELDPDEVEITDPSEVI